MSGLIVSESNNWELKERVMEFSFTYIGNIISRESGYVTWFAFQPLWYGLITYSLARSGKNVFKKSETYEVPSTSGVFCGCYPYKPTYFEEIKLT
jgi:hypothetical protein